MDNGPADFRFRPMRRMTARCRSTRLNKARLGVAALVLMGIAGLSYREWKTKELSWIFRYGAAVVSFWHTCVGWDANGAAVRAGSAHARQNGKRLGRPVTAALHADRVQKRYRRVVR